MAEEKIHTGSGRRYDEYEGGSWSGCRMERYGEQALYRRPKSTYGCTAEKVSNRS